MRSRIVILLACSMAFLYLFNSCKHKPFPAPTYGNFPDDVGVIFTTKCAVTGCHDAAGSVNADNLRLDSWESLFKGSSHGAVVIPYSTDYSSLLNFINTDSTRGLVAIPTMPYMRPALSGEEYYTIKNWIAAGAPDKDGNIPFASHPDTRQKIYVTQQGCDLMAVIDGESKLTMRMFHIGVTSQVESPHNVHFSNDGRYAYVSFSQGSAVQKIDASIDTVVQTINLGDGEGGVVNVHPDSDKVLVADFYNYELWKADFTTSQATRIGKNAFSAPHGIASTPTWDTFYVTSQYGNVVYRYTPGKLPPISNILLDTTQPASTGTGGLYGDPHEIIFSPDHSKLFVTCQHTNEVRVLDAHNYKVLAVLPVGTEPQEFAIAPSKHWLFVSCIYDAANPTPGSQGSVYVIDYTTNQVVNRIYGDFYQPHGMAVDERNNTLYIVSSNVSQTGPPPHHVTVCGGKPGWYSVYDLNTLQPLNKYRYESTIAPYSAEARFK
ncbi:MAG: hypothetical protein JSS82_02480 [Bacteroidetes bacterium]|nr:hypothetical protein [Bacteroidota bacterium]